MAKTLRDRLWKRGLDPHMIRRDPGNLARALCNPFALDVLPLYRADALAGKVSPRTALRFARFAIPRMHETHARWKSLGGKLP